MINVEDKAIQITSITDNIRDVESLIDDVCEDLKVNEDYYGNILIAVTEAVTNAIQHGNKYDASKNVNISCHFKDEKGVSFTVLDEGKGFDPTKLPDPTDPENIENPHGRGIFLMRHLADNVEFEEEGRKVVLDFSFSAN